MVNIKSERKVYSVTELNRSIRSLLEATYPVVWVEGEVSNFLRHRSGHIYFTLKDESSTLQAVFFRGHNQSIKFEMKDGLKVICLGRISVFEKRGQYQVYVEQVEPKGKGALQLAFEQLKEKLKKEGLFDRARKKALPLYPKKIGVVTSPTGAAIRDILNVVNRRFLGTHILLYPALVQGEGACEEIAQAIDKLNEFKDIEVLIAGRGGGSLEDLWAFNEEVVARAIARSRIPVISAVGHEVDWTIADMVADLRAPTPSAAAELVVARRDELEERISGLSDEMKGAMAEFISKRRDTLSRCAESYAFKQPKSIVDQMVQRLDDLVRHLTRQARVVFDTKASLFKHATGRLDALSPLAILARGYSMSFDSKLCLLKDAKQLKKGDRMFTYLGKGMLKSIIESIDTSTSFPIKEE